MYQCQQNITLAMPEIQFGVGKRSGFFNNLKKIAAFLPPMIRAVEVFEPSAFELLNWLKNT